jgi:phosphoglycerate kinase
VPGTVIRSRLSLDKAAKRLEELLGQPVSFVDNTVGSEVQKAVAVMQNGQVVMLENTRFYPEDEKGAESFAKKIVDDTGARLFVLDGFSVAHRDQASVTGVARVIKSRGGVAVAGQLVQKEIEFLVKALLEVPRRPYVAFLGGAKVADKIKVIDKLSDIADALVIGGAMLYPFLRAKGLAAGEDPLGRGEAEVNKDIETARHLLAKAESKIVIPEWVVAASGDGEQSDFLVAAGIPAGYRIKDVNLIAASQLPGVPGTIVWNGPFGQFEVTPYDQGTISLLKYISEQTRSGTVSVTGGGDTEKAIKVAKKAGVEVQFSHVSTGGGAMLELLEGKELPGLAVLTDK